MSGTNSQLISGVIGAISGGVAGSVAAWTVAPTQAEREDRGRRRVKARRQIAIAVSTLNYQLMEARGKLFRIESPVGALRLADILNFASAMRVGAWSLPLFERRWLLRRAESLIGRLSWRLAEIVPADHYEDPDESSILKATADTRTSTQDATVSVKLLELRPTDGRWDAAIRAVERLQKKYPT
jgi:hypothetical protein